MLDLGVKLLQFNFTRSGNSIIASACLLKSICNESNLNGIKIARDKLR